ncbi:DUF4113 domain-containing protein, partial [Escherichia coli]|nr:DUF4113 domain-containing protein [Escherichia coli]
TSIFSHPVYLFLRKFSLQDSRGGSLDELNQSGKGKVWFAGRGAAPEWQMKREMLSPSYTTQWTEIPIASF